MVFSLASLRFEFWRGKLQGPTRTGLWVVGEEHEGARGPLREPDFSDVGHDVAVAEPSDALAIGLVLIRNA